MPLRRGAGGARAAESRIESSAAVLIHSLSLLPRAAQRRLRPWQLILCLGSSDRRRRLGSLGRTRVEPDGARRRQQSADTVMAIVLGLLRRMHLLSRHALSASGWLGSLCRGLVLGIVGRSAAAALASRILAFKMIVLYFDVKEGNGVVTRSSLKFPREKWIPSMICLLQVTLYPFTVLYRTTQFKLLMLNVCSI